MRGSWQISVQLQADQVLVIHTKREHSHDETPARHVEFEWQVALALPHRSPSDFVARVEVRLSCGGSFVRLNAPRVRDTYRASSSSSRHLRPQITDYVFTSPKLVHKERIEEVQRMLEPWMSAAAPYAC